MGSVCVRRISWDREPMGWLQHNAHIDVGQPFAPEPDTGVPAALLRAKEENGLVVLFRGGGDRLRRHAGILLRRGAEPKTGLSGKAGACFMRKCPQECLRCVAGSAVLVLATGPEGPASALSS